MTKKEEMFYHKIIDAVCAIAEESHVSFIDINNSINPNDLDGDMLTIHNNGFYLYGTHYDLCMAFRDEGNHHGAMLSLSFGETYSKDEVNSLIHKIEDIFKSEIIDTEYSNGDVVSLTFTKFSNNDIKGDDFIHEMYAFFRSDEVKPILKRLVELCNVDY